MNTKTEHVILLREFLVTQMNHWILFPFYAVVMIELNDLPQMKITSIFLWLALGMIPFCLYLARARLKKFWAFMFVHLAVICFMFLLPASHMIIHVFYLLTGIGYVIYSAYLWSATKNRQDYKVYPLVTVVCFAAMLSILHYQGHNASDTLFYIILIFVLGIYFVVYYMEQYQKFLMVNNSSAGHISETEMFHSGIRLVLGYTAIGIIILMFVANKDWLRGILKTIQNIFTSLIRFLSSLFLRNADTERKAVVEEPFGGGADMSPMGELSEGFWLWEVLEYLIGIGLLLLFIFLLIKGIRFLTKFIKDKLSISKHTVFDTSEKTVVDVREKCDIIKSQEWKMLFPFLPQNPKERIRHFYKKRLLASRSSFSQDKKTLLNQYTARESGQILKRKELAMIYEKARYSNEECTNEDVKRMRDACK